MKTLITALLLTQAASAFGMTPGECESIARKTADGVGRELGSDGCNEMSSYGWLGFSKIEQGKCTFMVVLDEGGTQVQCSGSQIPGPGYVIRKFKTIHEFKHACFHAGFSYSLYEKVDGVRTITCKE